jgi:hypothetical protein
MMTLLSDLYEVLPQIYARLSCHDVNCLLSVIVPKEFKGGLNHWFEDALTEALLARLHYVQKPAAVLFEWAETIVDSVAIFHRALPDYPSHKMREQARLEMEELEKHLPDSDILWSLASMIADGTCSHAFLMFIADMRACRDVDIREGSLALVDLLARKGLMTITQHGDFLVHLMDEACVRDDTHLLHMAIARYKKLAIAPETVRKKASELLVIAIDAEFIEKNDENALLERVELLIRELGADPRYAAREIYFTPLSKACREGLEHVARHLVKKCGVHPTTCPGTHCCLRMVRFSGNKALERFIVKEMYNTRV